MFNFNSQFSLPENLKIMGNCPLCGSSTQKLEARVLRETTENQLVHLHCAACLGSVIALFMASGVGVASYGLITDLSYDDVLKFRNSDELTLDHVIRAHEEVDSPQFLAKIS
ncbi:MAG: hypothetical protein PHW53_02625 [Patescibacteria group bacterium]|nr:hypothetical protein [Patescibacteria group bacterium]